jgi:predicted phage terminase large subunit-like protein
MALTDEEEVEYLRLREVESPVEPLAKFIARISPHHPAPPHLAYVISRLERAAYEPIRLCVSMPPRHAKTTLIQHAFAWWLAWSPADTCAYASYSNDQAFSKSRVTRDLAEAAGVVLNDDMANLSEWRTADGGGALFGGAGSGLTGKGVTGLMVVDDPLKDRKEANSRTIRDVRFDWLKDVVMTRLEGASVIVVHTRWHPDDMIGRIEKEMPDFEVVNLPALAEENDPLGRAFGDALWPNRGLPEFTREGLERTRRTLGAYTFDALYQGRPRPRGAKVFGPPHYYDPSRKDFTGTRRGIGADPAATDSTASDYSAAIAGRFEGREDTKTLYITEVYRHQVQVPQFVNDLRAMQARNDQTEAVVEGAGIGKAVISTLKAVDTKIRVRESPTDGDKFQRAQGVAAAWNEGRVLVPLTPVGEEPAPWLKDFLDEVDDFTGVHDDTDDQVDALAHLWNGDRLGAGYKSPGHAANRRW